MRLALIAAFLLALAAGAQAALPRAQSLADVDLREFDAPAPRHRAMPAADAVVTVTALVATAGVPLASTRPMPASAQGASDAALREALPLLAGFALLGGLGLAGLVAVRRRG